jgi:hypothetical protein
MWPRPATSLEGDLAGSLLAGAAAPATATLAQLNAKPLSRRGR